MIDDGAENARDAVPDDGAERTAHESGHARFEEEDAAYVTIACADCFQDPDLAPTFSDRREQRIGDAKGGDSECDDPDSCQHDLDDAEVPTNGLDQVLRRARGIAEPGDPSPDLTHVIEAVGNDEDAGVARTRELEAAGRIRCRTPGPGGLHHLGGSKELRADHLLGHDPDDLGADPAAAHVGATVATREHAWRTQLDLGADRLGRGLALQTDAPEVAVRHRDLGAAPDRGRPADDDGNGKGSDLAQVDADDRLPKGIERGRRNLGEDRVRFEGDDAANASETFDLTQGGRVEVARSTGPR